MLRDRNTGTIIVIRGESVGCQNKNGVCHIAPLYNRERTSRSNKRQNDADSHSLNRVTTGKRERCATAQPWIYLA